MRDGDSTAGFFDSGMRRGTFALAVIVALGAAVLWVLVPDRPITWLRGMLTIPFVWTAFWLYGRVVGADRPGRDPGEAAAIRRYGDTIALILSVTLAVPMLATYGVAIWTVLGDATSPSPAARRLIGGVAGLTLMWLGNRLPTILTPLALLPPLAAARQQAARRGLGLVLVLAGLTMVAVYGLAPIDLASLAAKWIRVGLFLALICTVVWMNAGSVESREHTR